MFFVQKNPHTQYVDSETSEHGEVYNGEKFKERGKVQEHGKVQRARKIGFKKDVYTSLIDECERTASSSSDPGQRWGISSLGAKPGLDPGSPNSSARMSTRDRETPYI
jgi:hypothetical protein